MFDNEFQRKEIISPVDGTPQGYYVRQGKPGLPCMVVMHGHGSMGNQLFTRQDVAEGWTAFLIQNDFNIISPDMRGNTWMNATVVEDLSAILKAEKPILQWDRLLLTAGSMGGTAAFIFALRHPEQVDGVAAFGAATDFKAYCQWLDTQELPVLKDIHQAILDNYPTTESMDLHCAWKHADKLTMPIWYLHGGADQLIPVTQAHALADQMKNRPLFHYREIPGGDHDSPLKYYVETVLELLKTK